MAPPLATLVIDSDWATFQLTSDGATIQPAPGAKHHAGIVFTPTGVLFGQPNEQLQAKEVEIQFLVIADAPKVNFITGKGDTGTQGPRDGKITVILANHDYTNTNITGDGLNIKAFNHVPIFL